MPLRSVVSIVVLALVAGLGVGVVLGRAWGEFAEHVRQRDHRAQLDALSARRRAERIEALQRRASPLDSATIQPHDHLAELSRVQSGRHCLFTLRFEATSARPRRDPAILELRVEEAYVAPEARTLGMHLPAAVGWTHLPDGAQVGDTVTVIVPNTQCGMVVLHGYSLGGVMPAPPLQVVPR